MPPADHHANESERVIRFWLPSWYEWLFLFVASSVVFLIMNAASLWQFFNRNIIGAELADSSDHSILTAPVFDFLNSHETWIMLLLWGVIGCVVFGLVLLFQNIFRTARQEVAESQYRAGGVGINKRYWQSVARLDLTFAGLAIGWITFLFLYLNGIMPWVSHMFFSGLTAHWYDSYKIFIALSINTLAWYLFIKFTQVLLGVWHLIRPNQ